MTQKARPFVKWAGGKTQLLGPIMNVMPRGIRTYYEPFIGGGAVFFDMANEERFERAVLNDWNQELINTYKVVRDFPDDLTARLRATEELYKADETGGAQTYDRVRSKDPSTLDPVMRATRFIFLNKTCFNGLHRMNKRGEFNVPWGKYKTPAICDEANLRACAAVLAKSTTLHTGDFTHAVKDAAPGDVVYFDPPYVPLNASSDFAAYTSDGFGIDDQHRLLACIKLLVEKGVTVIESNSDTQVVRALYEGFEIIPIMAKRHINSKGDGRGPVGEVIIVSYGQGHAKPRPLYEMVDEDAPVPTTS